MSSWNIITCEWLHWTPKAIFVLCKIHCRFVAYSYVLIFKQALHSGGGHLTEEVSLAASFLMQAARKTDLTFNHQQHTQCMVQMVMWWSGSTSKRERSAPFKQQGMFVTWLQNWDALECILVQLFLWFFFYFPDSTTGLLVNWRNTISITNISARIIWRDFSTPKSSQHENFSTVPFLCTVQLLHYWINFLRLEL